MSLTIITVAYNSHLAISSNLKSLIDSNRFPVVIVDNGSEPESVEAVKKEFSNVNLLEMGQNAGYGRAANAGLSVCDTEYVLLINPDINIDVEMVVKLMQRAKEHKGESPLVAPAVTTDAQTFDGAKERRWISGSIMLIDVEAVREIGLFDENIFLYFEDSDLCQRVIDSGQKILQFTDFLVLHQKGQSCIINSDAQRMKSWHYGWSWSYFKDKHERRGFYMKALRRVLIYWIKSETRLDPMKRLEYGCQARGVLAYLLGRKAFGEQGRPELLP